MVVDERMNGWAGKKGAKKKGRACIDRFSFPPVLEERGAGAAGGVARTPGRSVNDIFLSIEHDSIYNTLCL